MNSRLSRPGILFLFSAPSGGGKTTLRDNLRNNADFAYSVSATTRSPRPGEIDGQDYNFLSHEEFGRRFEAGQFLESAEVHGQRYGTLRGPIVGHLAAGTDVLVDVDIQGARAVRACTDPAIRNALVDIFVMPPDIAALRQRLARRGTESAEQVELRLRNARLEMEAWPEYRYLILSGTPEEDLAKFRSIMEAERCRSDRYRNAP